ncbi:hypothetical protein FJZ23_02845 [Candidatus Parcubacteria bacterium]|nr:hypothetical protein [Candidatus Parcubacteria bacterium]
MSRIQKGTDTTAELQQIKGEVIKEIGAQNKGRPWLACFLVLLGFLIALGGTLAWAMAATGLVAIPGFSQFAYREPVPERVVLPGVPMETALDEQVTSALATRLQEGGGTLKDRAVVLSLDERSLTASLRTLLENSQNTTLDPASAQASIDPNAGITLFLPLARSPHKTALQISAIGRVEQGQLVFNLHDLRLGSLPVPDALTSFFLRPFLRGKIADANALLGSFVDIKEVEYGRGTVTVRGQFAVDIKTVEP